MSYEADKAVSLPTPTMRPTPLLLHPVPHLPTPLCSSPTLLIALSASQKVERGRGGGVGGSSVLSVLPAPDGVTDAGGTGEMNFTELTKPSLPILLIEYQTLQI